MYSGSSVIGKNVPAKNWFIHVSAHPIGFPCLYLSIIAAEAIPIGRLASIRRRTRTTRVAIVAGVRTIVAETQGDNVASVRLLKGVGFTCAGEDCEPGLLRFELAL